MQRFVFALEKVLKLKRQRLRIAEWSQARALAELGQARASAEACGQRAEIAAERLARPHEGLPWLMRFESCRQLTAALEAARGGVREAEDKLAEANRIRRTIEAEVESLLAIRKQQWEQWRRRFHREQQARVDELQIRRWRDSQTQ